jgi:hypothetical protein
MYMGPNELVAPAGYRVAPTPWGAVQAGLGSGGSGRVLT